MVDMNDLAPGPLVFDHVVVDRIRPGALLLDGREFRVELHNDGQGPAEAASIRADVSGTAIACLGTSLAGWLTECVERRGQSHQNDGNKIRRLLAEEPLEFDSRYVLD
jgi:hypothetical protein